MNSVNLLVLSATILVCWLSCYEASPVKHLQSELEISNNCRDLCGHCGCTGFYCGDECICDCNQNDIDAKCVETMDSNCQKLKLPFEVLIQGPNGNQFRKMVTEADELLQMEQEPFNRKVRNAVSDDQPRKKSGADEVPTVPANELTNETVAPVKTASQPNQSVIASLSAGVVETKTEAPTDKPETNESSSTSSPVTEKMETEATIAPITAENAQRTKREDETNGAATRDEESGQATTRDEDSGRATTREEEEDDDEAPAGARDEEANAPSARDESARDDGGRARDEEDGSQVGSALGLPLLPLLPLPALTHAGLPILGAIPVIKSHMDLKAIQSVAAKHIAGVQAGIKKNLAAAKIASVTAPLKAAHAAVINNVNVLNNNLKAITSAVKLPALAHI